MLSILKLSFFVFGFFFVSSLEAATGSGHVQTELSQPLSVAETQTIDFGTIEIDPSAGPQTVSMNARYEDITCPATYVCQASGTQGLITTSGLDNQLFHISLSGSVAILSDGQGNILTFDPFFWNELEEKNTYIPSGNTSTFEWIGGTLSFTGDEPAGTYSSSNAGGSPYVVTVNYY
ncbi:MAG: DUF4402 domain-containing protein [Alphaproteobacteria bacterium]|nr:DUF4402 domain-containing protein [Alphaproteobacteria bacterium]